MRNILPNIVLLALLTCAVGLVGFQQSNQTQRDSLIQVELEKKIAKYEYSITSRCRNEALKLATVIADSLLIELAKANRDTSFKPPKPNRPGRPDIVQVPDTTPIRPLLPDEIDSLQLQMDTTKN